MKYVAYTHHMKLYLWRRANRASEETGEAMIYLRVEIQGYKRAELSTSVKATEAEWSPAKERVVLRPPAREEGQDEEVYEELVGYIRQQVAKKNKKLRNLVEQVEQAYTVQKSQGGDPTPADLKDLMRHGETKRPLEPTLLDILAHYLQFKQAKKLEQATLRSIVTTTRSVREYLTECKQPALVASQVTVAWCRSYERWCQRRGLKPSTTHKYIVQVIAALQEGVAEGLLTHNPAQDYNFLTDIPAPDKRHLSPEEVQRIADYAFESESLRKVARLFLFACYTGLSYADYVLFAKDPESYISWVQVPNGPLVKGYALRRQKLRGKQKEEQWTPFFKEANALLGELPILAQTHVNRTLKVIAAQLVLSLPDLKHKDARSTFAQMRREEFDLTSASQMLRHSEKVAEKHYSTESATSLIKRMMDKGATFIYN